MPERIKILHVSPSGNLYGTERHILSIVKYSDKNKFEHWVVMPERGYFNAVLDSIGIKNIIAGRKPGKKKRLPSLFKNMSYKKLIKLIKSENFDIIHSHLISYGAFAGRLFSKAKIFHTRHGVFWSEEELENITFFDKRFQALKNNFFDITIAIGEYEKKTMMDHLGYSEKKIRLTFNGVTINDITAKIDKSVSKKEIYGTESIVVGAVGRLERQKGFHLFIEAAAEVIKTVNDVKFVIVGDGSLKNHLETQIKKLGLEKNFELISYKENIFDYINNMDIVVQTSLWEGISYSVLEPMALSKPVVALSSPNTSGVKEIIVEGVTGNLIFDDYSKKMSSCLVELIGNRDKSVSMGKMGFDRVNNYFTETRTASDMEKYYLEAIS